MAVNDMFLDDEGLETTRMRTTYLQEAVTATKEEYSASSITVPIKIPLYRSYETLHESRGIEQYVKTVNESGLKTAELVMDSVLRFSLASGFRAIKQILQVTN